MKGYQKDDLLRRLSQLKRVHGLTMKDSITDIKHAIVDATHGNKEPRLRPDDWVPPGGKA